MGRSAASGNIGKMGLGNMDVSSHFVPVFLPLPPVSRHFPATCRGCSYNFYRDLMMNPDIPPFPPIAPHLPHFSIFPIFPRRLRGLGDFGFGYLRALFSGVVGHIPDHKKLNAIRRNDWKDGTGPDRSKASVRAPPPPSEGQ